MASHACCHDKITRDNIQHMMTSRLSRVRAHEGALLKSMLGSVRSSELCIRGGYSCLTVGGVCGVDRYLCETRIRDTETLSQINNIHYHRDIKVSNIPNGSHD